MYAQSQVKKVSPLKMRWIPAGATWFGPARVSRSRIFLPPAARAGLPTAIFGFAVAQLFAAKNTESPLEDLMLSRGEYPAPVLYFG